MTPARDYWKNKEAVKSMACPNVSLFRLLGLGGVKFETLRVLEVGFGGNHGEDLIEFDRRGSICKGVDLSQAYVEEFNLRYPTIETKVMDIGKDEFPFAESFDVIYSRDTIYYLTNDEIAYHFAKSYQQLNDNGFLAFQFIEKDLLVDVGDRTSYKFDFLKFSSAKEFPIAPTENPIKFLDIDLLISMAKKVGFSLFASKSLIESYDNDETKFRLNRYLMLKK